MLADQPVDLRAKTIPEKTHAGFSLAFLPKKVGEIAHKYENSKNT